MFTQPLVSVGVPVYNGETGIENAISALLMQTYTNIEIVVSDNGSTDKTNEILTRLSHLDKRIRVFRSELNRGSIWNFNKVFKESSGIYFMWAAHDDLYHPDFISKCVNAMEGDTAAVLCTPQTRMTLQKSEQVIYISNLKSFCGKHSLQERYRETLHNFPAVAMYGLYRKESLSQTALIPRVVGGDMLMIQQLSIIGRFIEVPEILFTYRGREKWNSVHEDFMTFFGKKKKPWFYSPFLMLAIHQIKSLINAQISQLDRARLLLILVHYQLEQLLLKVVLKTLRDFIPFRRKEHYLKLFYWRFMCEPNVFVVEEDLFTNRIVKPRLGLED